MPTQSTPDAVTLLLVGNPNSGKTTLFNELTGARAKVGNYPGVTVEQRSGAIVIGGAVRGQVTDLPGTYSLLPQSPEEEIAAGVLAQAPPNAVAVVVVDGSAMARGLYLAVSVAELGIPLVVAVTMLDEIEKRGARVDVDKVEAALGAPCVLVAAKEKRGFGELLASAERVLARGQAPVTAHLDGIEATGPHHDPEVARITARYALVDRVVADAVREPERHRALSKRVDDVLTHPVAGLVVFAAVMAFVFETLFRGAEPAVDLIEGAVSAAQTAAVAMIPAGVVQDLVTQGAIAGVGNVVVFVPQIALLFLLIGFLEDSGYLARVAFLIDRLMGTAGLHGKAFVPMLSGFACAIPAIMATRTIESRRDRLLTMMVTPLMSCSARLPIYVLITGVVFASAPPVFGVFSAGAAVLFSMYALSVAAALAAAAVLRRTVLKGPRPTLLLELPPYRLPTLRNLGLGVWYRVKSFLVDAGTIILALTIVLWALLSFPRNEAATTHFDGLERAARAELVGEALEARTHELEGARAAAQLESSVAGHLGKFIEPALAPLGMDWRIGVGVIGAFAAREVFVSTLGIVFGIGDSDESSSPLRKRLGSAVRADGTKLMTPLSGVALMVFFVLACQCMSTIAVVRRESGTWRWPAFMFGYMTLLAYGVTLLVYQGGKLLGFH
jgi:ferrous iron transport protein B